MIAVAIIGILGAVALPQYFNQVQKTRQNEAAASLSQIQTTIAAFVDEMGLLPESWNDLNKITPLMTPEGPANQTNFQAINLAGAGCTETQRSECYQVDASERDQIFTLIARSRNRDAAAYNVVKGQQHLINFAASGGPDDQGQHHYEAQNKAVITDPTVKV